MKGLTDRVALITGAARGIGFHIAKRLAEEGVHTILTDIDEIVHSSFEQIKDGQPGNKGYGALMDVTRKNQVTSVVDQVAERLGRLDILVNNAGVIFQGGLLEMSEQQWDLSMAVNVKSVLFCSQAVLPHMIQQGNGSIVNIASQAGKIAEDGIADYCTSKAAVIRLTQCFALEMVAHNIRSNCVCPGATQTALVENVFKERHKVLGISEVAFKEQFVREIPMKRIAQPEEIAAVVAFLASDDSSYMTGQAINITGGRVGH